MTNPQEPKIKLLAILPAEKLYAIHNELQKYHHQWDKSKALELADTSGIENFYTNVQYLNRVVPIVGVALVASDYTQAGIVTAGISLYADYLITIGKEKIFKSAEKKQKLTELTNDIVNLYHRHYELATILKPLRPTTAYHNLNQLLTMLKEAVNQITNQEPLATPVQEKFSEKYLGYIFWSLQKQQSNDDYREIALLTDGIKSLDSWDNLSTIQKIKSEFSGFFISARKNHDLWKEWTQQWAATQLHHEKVKHLLAILQEAISEYQQDIPINEIDNDIAKKLLDLELVNNDEKPEEITDNNAINSIAIEEAPKIRRRTSHHSINIEQKQYTAIEQPPK